MIDDGKLMMDDYTLSTINYPLSINHMKPCLDYALHYINRFPKTEFELRLQLRKKGYYEEEIDETMQQMFVLNYVNDYEYTKLYLNSECIRKGKSLYAVKGKLLQKWVDKELISELVDELEPELIDGQIQKINKEIDKLKEKWVDGVKIIQKLQGRWYHFELIKEAIEGRE